MSDRKGQEPYDFTHMWDIKQKSTNEHSKNKLIDTDNNMVVTRREGESGEDEEGKGGQICGDGGTPDSRW